MGSDAVWQQSDRDVTQNGNQIVSHNRAGHAYNVEDAIHGREFNIIKPENDEK